MIDVILDNQNILNNVMCHLHGYIVTLQIMSTPIQQRIHMDFKKIKKNKDFVQTKKLKYYIK